MRHVWAQTTPIHKDMIFLHDGEGTEGLKVHLQARECHPDSLQKLRPACPSVQKLAWQQGLQVTSRNAAASPAFSKVRAFQEAVTDGVIEATKITS